MKSWLLTFLIILIYTSIFSQDIPGQTFGGSRNDVGLAVCLTNDGGYMLAGSTRSFGAGSSDIYIVKLDKKGNTIWSRSYGWIHKDIIRSVIPVNNGYILAGDVWDYGFARLDMYMMKIDNSGNIIWDQLYGSHSRELGFKAIQSNDGGFFMLGYTRDEDPVGDLWLVKTDAGGNLSWSMNYGSSYDDYGFDLVQENSGDVIMIGSKGGFFDDIHANFKNSNADLYLIKTDGYGNEVWKKTFGGNEHDFGQSIVQANESGLYLFGSSQSGGKGSFDMMLIKTDLNANEEWKKFYGGSKYEYGKSIDINAQNELFLLGTTKSYGIEESADMYLLKVDEYGDEIWSLTIGGDLEEYGHQVLATADSGCVVIGQSNNFGNGGFDFLFTKIDKNGFIEYFISGVDTTNEDELIVYPNPLRGKGRVKISPNQSTQNYRMQIVSLNGEVEKTIMIYGPEYYFNTSDLSAGLYIYRVISENSSTVVFKGKLIIY